LIDSNNRVVAILDFYEPGGGRSGGKLTLFSYNSSGNITHSSQLWGGRICLYDGDLDVANNFLDFGVDNGQITLFLDPQKIPTSTPYVGTIYRSGNNLCIKPN
jgi:hypothetical protein